MKTTAQRLSGVYCRPTAEEEWDLIESIDKHITRDLPVVSYDMALDLKHYPMSRVAGHHTLNDRAEIPVQHFIDLLNDSIVGWRLEEDGFEVFVRPDTFRIVVNGQNLCVEFYPPEFEDKFGRYQIFSKGTPYFIATYTELTQLIKFLTRTKHTPNY